MAIDLAHRAPLERFLLAVLADRRERLIGFATSPRRRTQLKFLATFLDELELLLDPRVVVPLLPEAIWSAPAFVFQAPRDFGLARATFDEALEARGDRPRLVITQDGIAGCLDTEWRGRVLVIGRGPIRSRFAPRGARERAASPR